MGSHSVVSRLVNRNQPVGKQSVRREEKSVLEEENHMSARPVELLKTLRPRANLYIHGGPMLSRNYTQSRC